MLFFKDVFGCFCFGLVFLFKIVALNDVLNLIGWFGEMQPGIFVLLLSIVYK